MTKHELGRIVGEELERLYPDAACSLEYEGEPWKLLVMARLSAQCTDARVNIVSKELWKKYPTQKALAEANLSELENIVRPCGLYKTKAKSILEAAKIIENDYGGRVPELWTNFFHSPA